MVFLEFIKAETYYFSFRNNFTNTPARIDALNKLVAVLYRPKQKIKDNATWNGDIRELYNDNTITHRALKVVAYIPNNIKYAILLFYEGSRKVRISRYKNVFDKSPGGSKGGTWIDALRNMAGGARHMEEMGNVDVDLALFDLDKIIKESHKKTKPK